MRLLGKCPLCGTEDSLVVFSGEKIDDTVKCEKCGQKVNGNLSLWDFETAEERKGNKLIAVDVENYGLYAGLFLSGAASSKPPHQRLIAEVLNTAMIVRFKLRICFATEGGIQGLLRDGPVELRNVYSNFGLEEGEYRHSKASVRLLKWYEKVLRLLFEDELNYNRHRYGRAAILKLSDKPEDQSNALILLWVALAKMESRAFANRVFQELKGEEASLIGGKRFLAGLSDEDIVKLFVPPPGMEELFGKTET